MDVNRGVACRTDRLRLPHLRYLADADQFMYRLTACHSHCLDMYRVVFNHGFLGDDRHMLLELPALADLRRAFSPVLASCSGVMARLVRVKDQPMVSRSASLHALTECHASMTSSAGDEQTLFHPFSLVGCQ